MRTISKILTVLAISFGVMTASAHQSSASQVAGKGQNDGKPKKEVQHQQAKPAGEKTSAEKAEHPKKEGENRAQNEKGMNKSTSGKGNAAVSSKTGNKTEAKKQSAPQHHTEGARKPASGTGK